MRGRRWKGWRPVWTRCGIRSWRAPFFTVRRFLPDTPSAGSTCCTWRVWSKNGVLRPGRPNGSSSVCGQRPRPCAKLCAKPWARCRKTLRSTARSLPPRWSWPGTPSCWKAPRNGLKAISSALPGRWMKPSISFAPCSTRWKIPICGIARRISGPWGFACGRACRDRAPPLRPGKTAC